MSFRDDFVSAIHQKKLVAVTAKTDEKGIIERKCVPFDYGPGYRPRDGVDYYHLRDVDSPDGPHNLTLLPSQLLDLKILDETFDPKEYVHGRTGWHVSRDWGRHP